ncbi:hypothetical protein [Empedobacter falsenii]|uniref:hypothetical protein n=1 Tax=Empedobacter falsenii TaxID=343874 RepID=UPI003A7F8674
MTKAQGIIHTMKGWLKQVELQNGIDSTENRFVYKYNEISRDIYNEVIENYHELSAEFFDLNLKLISNYNDSLEEYIFTLSVQKTRKEDLPHYFGGDY